MTKRIVLLLVVAACGNRTRATDKPVVTGDKLAAVRQSVEDLCADCHFAGAERAIDLSQLSSDPLLAARSAQMVGAHRMPLEREIEPRVRRELVANLCGLATPDVASCVKHMTTERPIVVRSSSEILADVDAFAPAAAGSKPTGTVRQLATFDAPVVNASLTMQVLLAALTLERCPAETFASCAERILSLELQALPPLPPTRGSK